MTRKPHFIFILLCTALFFRVMAQKSHFVSPAIENEKSWTMVVLPDLQTYVKFERNQGIFDIMTAWIAENTDPLRIKMVLCTGDLVEQNNTLKGDRPNGNQSSINQWRAVDRSISRLDQKVQYILLQAITILDTRILKTGTRTTTSILRQIVIL